MSLKAKLEAVIYASEEPVTLAQLAGLFADEALEWKAEQAAAAQAEAEEPAADENAGATLPEAGATNSETGAEAASEDASAPDADRAEAEAKRAAKLRDREARGVIRQLLDELIAEYAIDGRGVEIREIAGGYRMATKPEYHEAVRSFIKGQKPPLKLSLPALETLAVIAYKQPVTAPEVNEIRGVDSSGVFGSLLARKLIVTAGRKPVIGRPILYKTTREFLLRFGLKDVSELPSMEEFEKIAASELEEPGVAEPEDAGPQPSSDSAAATEAAAEFNPDLSTETDGGTNGRRANHEAKTPAQSPQAASDASAGDAE